jgi:hypothetical protein
MPRRSPAKFDPDQCVSASGFLLLAIWWALLLDGVIQSLLT